ncbi:hypothetical protein [Sedimentibacter sp. B4]|uniref:anti-sigma factor domain-containing protein n=1 Tax=Sedimentibacter sp. B4 TaxID=304766 RepID=UPI0004B5DB56|nr:hypothetical protein [Sedimentibacter sp. B4]
MKGIVIEINNDQAAVLSDNGAVVRIKNKNYKTGQVVKMKENKNEFYKKSRKHSCCFSYNCSRELCICSTGNLCES